MNPRKTYWKNFYRHLLGQKMTEFVVHLGKKKFIQYVRSNALKNVSLFYLCAFSILQNKVKK